MITAGPLFDPQTFNPLAPEHLANPWSDYEMLRRHYPVVWNPATQSWLISRYEDIYPLLRDGQHLTHEYVQEQLGVMLGDARTMTSMEGHEHTSRRALLAPYVVASGRNRLASIVDERARALMGPLFDREAETVAQGRRSRGEIDLVREFSSIYPVDIMATIMALPNRQFNKFQEWYTAFIDTLANITGDPDIHARGVKAKAEFGEYILPLITERRAEHTGDDLISQLCRAEVDGQRMTDEDIRSFLALMLTAGGETTDHQLAALLYALVSHPDQLRQVQEDRSLVTAAMAEGMRYCTIIRFIQREAREDFDVNGTVIPAGSRVTLMLSSGNRDPQRFEEPDRFDIHRSDNDVKRAFSGNPDHLGFGGGRHVCLGAQLSRREVEVALNLLLDSTEDLKLADGFEPEWGGILIRSLPSLRLTFQPISG